MAHFHPGFVKLLLDGQQRITSLYGIIRGKPPQFFDGNAQSFTGLYFDLENEAFEFYAPAKMKGNPLWINIEEVAGEDKTVDMVVDIFNRVNSGGAKLSKGDLALAKICAEWPDARCAMKARLTKWRKAGFHFRLDWLLRVINANLTGEALFTALKDVTTDQFRTSLDESGERVDRLLNMIANRLGLDHDRVLGSRGAFPVMVRYLTQRGGKLTWACSSSTKLSRLRRTTLPTRLNTSETRGINDKFSEESSPRIEQFAPSGRVLCGCRTVQTRLLRCHDAGKCQSDRPLR